MGENYILTQILTRSFRRSRACPPIYGPFMAGGAQGRENPQATTTQDDERSTSSFSRNSSAMFLRLRISWRENFLCFDRGLHAAIRT